MPHQTTRPGPGEVILDGVVLPHVGQVRYNNLGTFEGKVTTGSDFSVDSDDVISSRIYTSTIGGLGVDDETEGAHSERFAWAVADTRYPRQLSLPPLAERLPRPVGIDATADCYPLGDLHMWDRREEPVNSNFFCAWYDPTKVGSELRVYKLANRAVNPTAADWEFWGSLGSRRPQNKPVIYEDRMYIPLDREGWAYLSMNDNAGRTKRELTLVTNKAVRDFEVWDDKLFAVNHRGDVSYTINPHANNDAASAWESSSGLKVKAGRPRKLIAWFNRAGDPTLYVVTSRNAWIYDPLVPVMKLTNLRFPRMPDAFPQEWSGADPTRLRHMTGVTTWRSGENLWITAGPDIIQWSVTQNVIPGSGLVRDDGPPETHLGALVDLEGDWNFLYGLALGNPEYRYQEEVGEEGPAYRGDASYVPTDKTMAYLVANNGQGWHNLWESPANADFASWSLISSAYSSYSLMFGVANTCYRMRLRKEQHNPKKGRRVGSDLFAEAGYVRYPRFDAAMAGFNKLASDLHITVDHATENETIEFWIRTDSRDWFQVGRITAPGEHILFLGTDQYGTHRGISFRWIQLEVRMRRHPDFQRRSPIIDATVLHYIKIPQDTATFVVVVPITENGVYGMSARDLGEWIDGLPHNPTFSTLVVRDTVYRVRVASVGGFVMTGRSYEAGRTISLIEVGGGATRRPATEFESEVGA